MNVKAALSVLVLQVVALCLVALIVATMWATSKTRERTECYRRAPRISDCPKPGVIERAVRSILAVPTKDIRE